MFVIPTSKQRVILEILQRERREMYGLEIVKASQGRVKRGTVYVDLDLLEDHGYVVSREEPQDPPPSLTIKRRLYRLTGKRVPEPDVGLDPNLVPA